MSECLGVFKTNRTMYLDFDRGYWDTDKPYYGKCYKDYTLMRTGTVLKAYKLLENEYFDGIKNTIKVENKKHIVYFEDLKDLKNCTWLDELEKEDEK